MSASNVNRATEGRGADALVDGNQRGHKIRFDGGKIEAGKVVKFSNGAASLVLSIYKDVLILAKEVEVGDNYGIWQA